MYALTDRWDEQIDSAEQQSALRHPSSDSASRYDPDASMSSRVEGRQDLAPPSPPLSPPGLVESVKTLPQPPLAPRFHLKVKRKPTPDVPSSSTDSLDVQPDEEMAFFCICLICAGSLCARRWPGISVFCGVATRRGSACGRDFSHEGMGKQTERKEVETLCMGIWRSSSKVVLLYDEMTS